VAIRPEKAERLADEDLMPLIAERDARAFEVFYDRHAGAAYSLAYRIVGSQSAAEDVTRGSVRAWALALRRAAERQCKRADPAGPRRRRRGPGDDRAARWQRGATSAPLIDLPLPE
jgi:hypothetical protein